METAIILLLIWLISLSAWRKIHKLFRQIRKEPQRFRSRAWWIAILFHLLWLPAWYGQLATASQSERYNPAISDFMRFNSIWLLTAVALQTVIALLLLWQYKHGHPRAFVRCAAFVLTGWATMVCSLWCAGSLYPPLYGWWWQALLQAMNLDAEATLNGLNHTAYGFSSVWLYLLAWFLFNLLGGLWCYLLFKLTPAQPLTQTKEDL